MTLTSHRPARAEKRSPQAAAVPARNPEARKPEARKPEARKPEPSVFAVFDDVYRVRLEDSVVGYVQVAGPVYVVLSGEAFNTSVEVAQCLDLETAIELLVRESGP